MHVGGFPNDDRRHYLLPRLGINGYFVPQKMGRQVVFSFAVPSKRATSSGDPRTLELHDRVLLIPTEIVEREGTKIKAKSETRCRITTLLSEKTRSRWAPYIISKKDIANKILGKFDEMGRYLT